VFRMSPKRNLDYTLFFFFEISGLLKCYTVSLRLEFPTFQTILVSFEFNSPRKNVFLDCSMRLWITKM